MRCTCGGSVVVKDSRTIPEGIWRQRKCLACGCAFTTLEQRCVTLQIVRGLKDEGQGTVRIKVEKPPTAVVHKPSIATRKKTRQAPIPPLVIPAPPKPRHIIEDLNWERQNETLFDDR